MSDLRSIDLSRLLKDRSLTRLAILVVALLVAFSAASPNFLTVLNFQSMGFQVAEIGILSLAMTVSMLTGGIDLSIVSVANICAITTAKLFAATHAAEATGGRATLLMIGCVLGGLAVGTLGGVVNGLLVTRLGITPILATLGTLQLYNGIAIVWTGGAALYGFPDAFLNVGSFYVARVPIPVIILVAAALATGLFINKTGLGLRVRLVGANPTAASYTGLNNDRVLMATYMTSALLASVAGIVISARSASANADYGVSYILLTIVIAVLGGVNYMGGYGTVTGVVLAAFALQFVGSGLNMLGMNQFLYNVAQGIILIGAMALNVVLDRRQAARAPDHRRGLSALRRRQPQPAQGTPEAAASEPLLAEPRTHAATPTHQDTTTDAPAHASPRPPEES
jgi:simple sugar transport system permease protein